MEAISTRFTSETARAAQAKRKNRGGGRPTNEIKKLVMENSAWAVSRLRELAEDEDEDPARRFAAVIQLAKMSPKFGATSAGATEPTEEKP